MYEFAPHKAPKLLSRPSSNRNTGWWNCCGCMTWIDAPLAHAESTSSQHAAPSLFSETLRPVAVSKRARLILSPYFGGALPRSCSSTTALEKSSPQKPGRFLRMWTGRFSQYVSKNVVDVSGHTSQSSNFDGGPPMPGHTGGSTPASASMTSPALERVSVTPSTASCGSVPDAPGACLARFFFFRTLVADSSNSCGGVERTTTP
mmetsp:Transcript_8716/g.24351  ORF Transcript_8716/g.24351 Transcript_8716/m.24351 type:complete len:204 (-) Transcript_8716:70-681(-)